jgi:predicted transcriptional regulator
MEECDAREKGKCRPLRIYSLRVSIDDIIRFYEEEKAEKHLWHWSH